MMINTGFRGKSYGWERIKDKGPRNGRCLVTSRPRATAGVDDTKNTTICNGLTSAIQPLAGMGELA
ncbi:MAG: hypothetical protein VX289_03795 [Candidatus Poribacteria bacterium]|nr:hypothetical protein [Candidatus Poribacteria bacterium]